MLINAAQHPGPAIFQGIGLIVIAIVMVAMGMARDRTAKPKPEKDAFEADMEKYSFIAFIVMWALFSAVAIPHLMKGS